MNDTDLQLITQTIEVTVKKTVNGKIDNLTQMMSEHNVKHEKDMEDMKPIIQAWNTSQELMRSGTKVRTWFMRAAGFIAAVGGAWIVIYQIIHPNSTSL